MNNEIKVVPTPIQRNLNDVAMELTELYYRFRGPGDCTIEKIREVYKKFYATALEAVNMDLETANNK